MIINEMMNYNFDNPSKEVQKKIINKIVDVYNARERDSKNDEFIEPYVDAFVDDKIKIMEFKNHKENNYQNTGIKLSA